MDCLSIKMNSMERVSVGNALCDALHNRYSNSKFYDMVGGNHNIYTYHECVLKAYDVEEAEMVVTPKSWCAKHSALGVHWWESGFENKWEEELKRVLLLTTK